MPPEFDIVITSNLPQTGWGGGRAGKRNAYSASSAMGGLRTSRGHLGAGPGAGAPDDVAELLADLRYWKAFKGQTRNALRQMSRTAAKGIRENIVHQTDTGDWPPLSKSYMRWKQDGEIRKKGEGWVQDPSGYGGAGNAGKMLIYTGEYVHSIDYRESGIGDNVEFEVGPSDPGHQQLAYSLEYGGAKPSALTDKFKWAPHVLARPHMGRGYEEYHENIRHWYFGVIRSLARKPSGRRSASASTGSAVMAGGMGIGI